MVSKLEKILNRINAKGDMKIPMIVIMIRKVKIVRFINTTIRLFCHI